MNRRDLIKSIPAVAVMAPLGAKAMLVSGDAIAPVLQLESTSKYLIIRARGANIATKHICDAMKRLGVDHAEIIDVDDMRGIAFYKVAEIKP